MTPCLDEALIAAMRAGATDVVIAAIAESPALVTAADANGMTLLHWAVATDQPALLAELLTHPTCDVEARQASHGRTALHMAAIKGRIVLVRRLLDAGADPHALDAQGLRPLDLATTREAMAALRPATLDPARALRDAVDAGAMVPVERLLAARPDLGTVTDHTGRTLVHVAVARGDRPMVDVMLAAGLVPTTRDGEGESPLHEAARRGDAAIVQALLAAGAEPTVGDLQGITPLHLTAGHGDATHPVAPPPPAGLLVETVSAAPDVPPTQCAFDFDAPAPPRRARRTRAAAHMPSPAPRAYQIVAELLLAAGAPTDARARGGTTPLHLAAYVGDIALAALLLRHGASTDAQLALWRATPAHVAATRGHADLLHLLREHGANISARDAHGRTPGDLLAEDEPSAV